MSLISIPTGKSLGEKGTPIELAILKYSVFVAAVNELSGAVLAPAPCTNGLKSKWYCKQMLKQEHRENEASF
jgi:hypothetical protein